MARTRASGTVPPTVPEASGRPVRPDRRRTARLVVAALLACGAAYVLLNIGMAAQGASRGRALLQHAEGDLAAGNLDRARAALTGAERSFRRIDDRLDALGPVTAGARRIPVLRSQLRAVETFGVVGSRLSSTGVEVVRSAQAMLESEGNDSASISLTKMRGLQRTVELGIGSIDQARTQVKPLQKLWLVPPLGGTQRDLAKRLTEVAAKARSAERGLAAFITFAGGSGPRQYLYLSQNPDEVRPTGGVIGTYGLLTAADGKLSLARYEGTEDWYATRPDANVPPERAGSPFRFFDPPFPRTIANVNTTPDWPEAARLAIELWRRGGEEPVQGVISFTPSVLGRILSVIGPVDVPEYADTVTAENIIARLDFHAHPTDPALLANRKDFIGVLAQAVLNRLLVVPSSQLLPLGRVIGQAFDAREAVAYSTDREVADALRERRWDGAMPTGPGDFFLNGEIEYIAKNGRGIRREFKHHVAIRPDGRARITTEVTLYPRNSNFDQAFHSYIVVYGPEGATLAEGSDPPKSEEPPVGGHPAAGWFRGAGLSIPKDTLKVVWDAPNIARRMPDGTWEYSLRWMRLPDHTGDTLTLSFDLPPGWRWRGPRPPAQFDLGQGKDLVGTWRLVAGKSTT